MSKVRKFVIGEKIHILGGLLHEYTGSINRKGWSFVRCDDEIGTVVDIINVEPVCAFGNHPGKHYIVQLKERQIQLMPSQDWSFYKKVDHPLEPTCRCCEGTGKLKCIS